MYFKMEKVFIHFLDRNKKGEDVDVKGYFELVEETNNFLVIKTDKNTLRIPYRRIIKIKGGQK